MASLGILRDPSRHYMYATWLAAVRGNLTGLRLDLLAALAPPGPYALDFVTPSPTSPSAVLADELETVASTPPAVVRAELELVYQGRPLPTVLRRLWEDPAGQLPELVREMRRYWDVAVEPVWQRVRALGTADLSYRAERFAAGGVACVLKDLHPEISYASDRLLIDKPHHCSHRVDLLGTGIVLIPCAFSWPRLTVQCCHADLPTLSYPPRGLAELSGSSRADEADPLGALVGKTRATLLAVLGVPRTTTQLAKQLDLSPAAVSQHLKILQRTTMVTAKRHGRLVLYQRTAAATALLTAVRPDAAVSYPSAADTTAPRRSGDHDLA